VLLDKVAGPQRAQRFPECGWLDAEQVLKFGDGLLPVGEGVVDAQFGAVEAGTGSGPSCGGAEDDREADPRVYVVRRGEACSLEFGCDSRDPGGERFDDPQSTFG